MSRMVSSPVKRLDGVHDGPLGGVVQGAGRLVEHQHAGLFVERAGNADTLPLPAGKAHAALADDAPGIRPAGAR